MFDRSRTRFHDKNWQKSGEVFFGVVQKVFDRVKTVALWSAKKINKKDHKGLRFPSQSSTYKYCASLSGFIQRNIIHIIYQVDKSCSWIGGYSIEELQEEQWEIRLHKSQQTGHLIYHRYVRILRECHSINIRPSIVSAHPWVQPIPLSFNLYRYVM